MPWALFNRPSIQLGTLKAYLESNHPELLVDTSHSYLEIASLIDPELYYWISQSPWVSEALYAPLMFPEQASAAEFMAMRYVRQAAGKIKRSFNFAHVRTILEKQLEEWFKRYEWPQYKIIGFSVCFHQLFASLAAARAIKKKYPQAKIVFGGSSCTAAAGSSLLNAFPFIDYVIPGEGERGLQALCAHLSPGQPDILPGNVMSRQTTDEEALQQKTRMSEAQLPALLDLPVPDFHDYFSEQKKWFPAAPFIPVLPVEFSRGCWWNRCVFCNLNLQWCGYRCKGAVRMLQEVKTLAARHGCLDFAFVDNMLPPGEDRKFFQMTRADEADFTFFAEIRSAKGTQLPAGIFPVYHRGGLATVQVGVEALSNGLLRKMRKGITVIENIATMRNAQENSIQLQGNLILQFPGSSETEVAETLTALDYVFPYPPLDIASFFLGLDSPIYQEPQKFGIRAIVDHPNNYRLFPRDVLQKMNLLVKDYRGDRVYQRKIWKPVALKIKKWQQFHADRKKDALRKPLLAYRDGSNFLLIRQELPDGKVLHHRLRGISRQIYLFCTQIRSETEICSNYPALRPEQILSFLADLQKKHMVYAENNKFLALAVHTRD